MRVATGLSVLGVLDVLVGHEALRYLAHCLLHVWCLLQLHQRRAVIVHLNWVCIFLGFLFARGSRLVPDKARLGLVRVVEAHARYPLGITYSSDCSGCTTPYLWWSSTSWAS